ncbi:MAG: 5-(carboxyamino)imidazole ribonucleotide mutase [Pirellula sp.]
MNKDLLGKTEAKVSVIMGSQSDWETMSEACEVLKSFDVPYETKIVSAHRTPQFMVDYASSAKKRGLQVIIAGAGGAAHLPGMVASCTTLPVLGVPVYTRNLQGLDSLLSIVQMPRGVPVATLAIGSSGARNAGLLAVRILSLANPDLMRSMEKFMLDQTESVLNNQDPTSING